VPIVERAINVLLARQSRLFDISKTHFIGDGEKRSYVSRERRTVMMKFGLIGAAALSLVLATPAMAMQRHHHHYYFHALKFHFGSTYGAYNTYHGYDFARRNTFN
jgi:NhaP-type Na+/H+ or K+/H+ antiporter